MNTPALDSLAELDSLIQLAMRQQILAALQKPEMTLEMLSKTMKLYQKTIEQELKAKALELKKQELAFRGQKLAADQAKAVRKQEQDSAKKNRDEASADKKPRVAPSLLSDDGKRKPVWNEAEAIVAAAREKQTR
jgi:hypothetical protein